MQAIITKYRGPTNTRGSRILASCQAKRIVVPYDYELSAEGNHDAAAFQLALSLKWVTAFLSPMRLVGGGLPDGKGNAYVLVPSDRD